jgi:hypothetical protein
VPEQFPPALERDVEAPDVVTGQGAAMPRQAISNASRQRASAAGSSNMQPRTTYW